jgi:hypothetical protein
MRSSNDVASPAVEPPPTASRSTPIPGRTDLISLMPSASQALPGSERTDSELDPTQQGFECLGPGNDLSLHPVAPGIEVDYLTAPMSNVFSPEGNSNVHFVVSRYDTPSEDKLRTLWSHAPAACANHEDYGEGFDQVKQRWVKIRSFDALVAPSLLYQARLTPSDGERFSTAAHTSLYSVSNGWYLVARSDGSREILDRVVPIVGARLDAKLGTHFIAGPADDYTVRGTPSHPVDLISNTSFGSLITDSSCSAPGIAFEENGKTVLHDVTGDGYLDALVSYSCASTTSSNPAKVYVFDGRHTRATRPRQLAELPAGRGHKLYLRDFSIVAKGRVVTLRASNLSPSAPLCCPDQQFQQTYTWAAGRFIPGPAKLTPLR